MIDVASLQTLGPSDEPSTLIIGSGSKSSVDLYIYPRLQNSSEARFLDSTKLGRPHWPLLRKETVIILNRYLSFRMLHWIRLNRSMIAKVYHLIDDDFAAMLWDSSILLLNRAKPLQTSILQKLNYPARLGVDVHLLVSSRKLVLNHPGATLIEPIANVPRFDAAQYARRDPRHVSYLAKMHLPEHRFLRGVFSKLEDQGVPYRLTVTAQGAAAKVWDGLPSVSIVPEMDYRGYKNFRARLGASISLAPLVPSRLNEARSAAKRVEIAEQQSAGLFAHAPAYRRDDAAEELHLPMDEALWAQSLAKLMNDDGERLKLAEATNRIVRSDYAQRDFLDG
ncbi:MAG: hypothetical protein AAFY73_04335 [Pseudomonadota bacterium]